MCILREVDGIGNGLPSMVCPVQIPVPDRWMRPHQVANPSRRSNLYSLDLANRYHLAWTTTFRHLDRAMDSYLGYCATASNHPVRMVVCWWYQEHERIRLSLDPHPCRGTATSIDSISTVVGSNRVRDREIERKTFFVLHFVRHSFSIHTVCFIHIYIYI